jgi:hypothetical protein
LKINNFNILDFGYSHICEHVPGILKLLLIGVGPADLASCSLLPITLDRFGLISVQGFCATRGFVTSPNTDIFIVFFSDFFEDAGISQLTTLILHPS